MLPSRPEFPMRKALIALSLVAAVAAPVIAQNMPSAPPGRPDPALVTAGSYAVETNHTQVSFGVDHLGLTPYYGSFSQVTGTLVLDPAKLSAATLTVSIPIASVQTTSAKLTDELKSPDWFDAAKFPTATFTSTKVTSTSPTTATVDGNLTLHGVTRPITLEAHFYGAGPNPMSKAPTIGFEARTKIRRADFGVSMAIPLVSDEVGLMIVAAFEKKA